MTLRDLTVSYRGHPAVHHLSGAFVPGVLNAVVGPFTEFAFMRRAPMATLALAVGCAPIGCVLVLRRMSLVGDAMANAVLPGAAAGFRLAGLSLPAMSLGGFVAALAVALAAGFVTRATPQREDASFAAFYLIALALGVLLVSLRGSQVDLMHTLFGSVLAVDDAALLQIAAVASLTLWALALLYRPLVLESFDPGFLRSVGGPGARGPDDAAGGGGALLGHRPARDGGAGGGDRRCISCCHNARSLTAALRS